jgi:tetratricopeptide (TPR) repeat protein
LAINKRKILESAQKHLQRGALDKALEDYRTLLKADPHDCNVLLKVGDLYLKQGKRDEAINSYLRVAQQFTRDGFDAKAVALYKQIARLDPKRNDVSVPLADLYARMGLVPDAIAALQAAADAAYRGGDKDGALELLRRMAGLDPANTPNRLKVAELFAKEKRVEEAVAEYQAVADELERRGEEEERIKVLERMLAVDPSHPRAALAVARARLRAQQWASARKLAENLLASQPDDLDAREILGHALAGEGEIERSRGVFRELAELYRLRGDEGRARDLMQRFGGLDALAPDDSDATLDDTDVPVLELETGAPETEFLLEPEPLEPSEPALKRAGTPRNEPLRAVPPPRAEPRPADTPRGEPARAEKPAPRPGAPSAKPAAAPAKAAAAAPSDGGDLDAGDPDQLLAEATVYLRYGKCERAVGVLRTILAREPDHRAALESLGEALQATGETSHAVTAWRRAAEAAQAAGDAAAAARLRERLAAADPEAAAALGGTEPALAPAAPDASEGGADVEIDTDLSGSLEGPDEAPTLAGADELDSLTIDLDEMEPLGGGEDAAAEAEPEPAEPAQAGAKSGPSLAPESPTATTPARVAEDLEEAEFYFEQGLLDEARAFYERILAAAPNHPQAMLRLGEIAARSGGSAVVPPPPAPPAPIAPPETAAEAPDPAAGPEIEIEFGVDLDLPEPEGAAPEPEEAAPAPAAASAALQAEVTAPSLEGIAVDLSGDFDLAAELSGSMGGDEPVGRTLAGTEEEAFEQVFAAFKTGVERELGEQDHEARYDLGIAYKEMGLLEDAIAAFQLAMGAPARKLACLHMMGLCALDLGRANDAVAHLEQALSLPDLPSDQRVPLRYDVGRAYAALGDVPRARAAFEEVRAADPGFGDVEGEIARLAMGPAAKPEGACAEAYESFDDLLAETRQPAAPRYESFDDLFDDDGEPEDVEPEPAAASEEPPPAPEPPANEQLPASEDPPAAPAARAASGPARRKRKISFV